MGIIFKDVPVLTGEQGLLLRLSWWRQIFPLQDDAVVVTLVHGFFLLVRMTKEFIPLRVVLTVQDVKILVVSHPEVENKVESRSG